MTVLTELALPPGVEAARVVSAVLADLRSDHRGLAVDSPSRACKSTLIVRVTVELVIDGDPLIVGAQLDRAGRRPDRCLARDAPQLRICRLSAGNLARLLRSQSVRAGSSGGPIGARLTYVIAHNASPVAFPVAEIEKEMAALGKSLTFDPTEIAELLELKYANARTFPVLALLYPGLDLSKDFHEDHIFPRVRFRRKQLRDAGVAEELIEQYEACVDLLPNLQLLGGVPKVEKRAKLPDEWLVTAFATDAERETYVWDNDLTGLPDDMASFLGFFEKRKARMRERLTAALGVSAGE